MDLNETLAFVTVVQTGSFTAAGKRLGAPKATISRRVSRLEGRLDARLLERTTRRIGLTAVGRAYFERCQHGIAEIENAERQARDVSGVASGMLRVSASFDIARDRLAGLLPEFHRKYPKLDFVFELTQRRVDLIAEGFDVVLRGGPKLDDTTLIARKLQASEIVLCATPRYLAKHGTPKSLSQLAEHQLIAIGSVSSSRRVRFEGPQGPEEVALEPWLVANEFGFLREVTLAGHGIGMLEVNGVAADLRAKRLRRVLPAYRLGSGALWAIYPSSHHLSPKVRVFIDFLVDKFAA